MTSINHLRKQGLYFKLISSIVHEVTNSEMSFPTVTRVELTNDGSHLYVYMNFESNPNQSLDALNRAKGFVRTQLASNANQRVVPQIHFKIDEATEHGKKIDAILKKIKEEQTS